MQSTPIPKLSERKIAQFFEFSFYCYRGMVSIRVPPGFITERED